MTFFVKGDKTVRMALGEKVKEVGDKYGPTSMLISSMLFVGALVAAMTNLFAVTDQRYYTKETSDIRFPSRGDLSYVHERMAKHEGSTEIHLTIDKARQEFVTRREDDIRQAAHDREQAELKRILLRLEDKLDKISE